MRRKGLARIWRRPRMLASAGLLVATAWTGASALFTGSAAVTTNDFTTGTIAIGAAPASALLTIGAMAPGDAVVAPLTVSNTGTLELRYSMTSSAAGDAGLAGAIAVTVKSGVASCTQAGFGLTGTVVGGGAVGTSAFGDPAPGSQPGDRVLAASASEVLCYQASLPVTAGNALQGTTATGTFTFSAEQTANNP